MLCCTVSILCTCFARSQTAPSGIENRLTDMVNSQAAVIYGLAKERFQAHQARGETWVMRVHLGVSPETSKKYTDGKYVILSFPVLAHEYEGAHLYVSHYNALTIRKADLSAFAGKYEEALTLYRLMQKYSNETNELKTNLAARIECVNNIISGHDKARWLKKIEELSVNYGRSAFEAIESTLVIRTQDLFNLKLDR